MPNRTLAAAALLVLLGLALIAGSRALTTGAAPAAQLDLVRAAIHPGTCVAPAAPAAVTLNEFTRAGEPNDTAAPLSSSTEAPVALAELLAAPHAIVVTLGGDLAATVACGEIADQPAAVMVPVDLAEQNDSGLSGISLLIADGDITKVSIILDEGQIGGPTPVPPAVAQASPVAIASPVAESPAATAAADATASPRLPIPTPPSIRGEPSPTAPAEPSPTTMVDDPTPTAGTGDVTPSPVADRPRLPIGLPPIAQDTTPTPVPSPTAAAGATAGSYTSAEFGYSLPIPDEWTLFSEPTTLAGFDQIIIGNGTSWIELVGFAVDRTPQACIDNHYQFMRSRPEVSLLVPNTTTGAAEVMSGPDRAVEVWDEVYYDAAGEPVARTLYVECRTIVPGQSVLQITHGALAEDYPAEAVLRDQVLSGLTLP